MTPEAQSRHWEGLVEKHARAESVEPLRQTVPWKQPVPLGG